MSPFRVAGRAGGGGGGKRERGEAEGERRPNTFHCRHERTHFALVGAEDRRGVRASRFTLSSSQTAFKTRLSSRNGPKYSLSNINWNGVVVYHLARPPLHLSNSELQDDVCLRFYQLAWCALSFDIAAQV
jgi:hypothetical protein